jgi:ABC-type multidrug transport system ATPase subunit
MKAKRVEITSFRHLSNVSFDLGDRLTIIAGGNGTGKTSILGLIGHVFRYVREPLSISGKKFETKYGLVFRFSPDRDYNQEYRYKVIFEDDSEKPGVSRTIDERGKVRFRIDVGGRERGGGKVKRPVVYLSLRRLIPLAQERTVKLNTGAELTDVEKASYNDLYNEIFAITEEIVPMHTSSANKLAYMPTNAAYDSYGVSAGQDNIGQIILSLIEFQRIKDLVHDYDGGVLLIDEIDATLYPAAQKNLVSILHREAGALGLQVIFTTHSSDILNFVGSRNGRQIRNNSNFVSLSNSTGNVTVQQGYDVLESVMADLNHEALSPFRQRKINVYFEDAEAMIWFKSIVSDIEDLEYEFDFKDISLSCSFYKTLIEKGFEEFERSIVVLDGDAQSDLAHVNISNVVFLPGINRPENEIRDHLVSLSESDSFWTNEHLYTKRVLTQDLSGVADDRVSMKRWFNGQLPFWGTEGERVFASWKSANGAEVSRVKSNTATIGNRVVERYFERNR